MTDLVCQAEQYCENKGALDGLTKDDEKNRHGKQILPHLSQGRGLKARCSASSVPRTVLCYGMIRLTWDESTCTDVPNLIR